MKIRDLNFPIQRYDINSDSVKADNLFNCVRVLDSIALWKTKPAIRERVSSPLFFLFGDTCSRIEWELGVAPDGSLHAPFTDNTTKRDVYRLYVEPNESVLLSMVDEVSVRSARLWLKERRYGRRG